MLLTLLKRMKCTAISHFSTAILHKTLKEIMKVRFEGNLKPLSYFDAVNLYENSIAV